MLTMALALTVIAAGTTPSAPVEVSFGGSEVSLEEADASSADSTTIGRGSHLHEIQIRAPSTPPGKISIVVELAGARKPAPVGKRIAAGAIVLAGAFLNGPVATAMSPWLTAATQELMVAERQVFVVSGKKLKPLGEGVYLLRFKCRRVSAGTPMARVTVQAATTPDAPSWQMTTAWTPLVEGSIAARSDP